MLGDNKIEDENNKHDQKKQEQKVEEKSDIKNVISRYFVQQQMNLPNTLGKY